MAIHSVIEKHGEKIFIWKGYLFLRAIIDNNDIKGAFVYYHIQRVLWFKYTNDLAKTGV